MADSATEVKELIRIVRDDSGLPNFVRRRAGELAALGSTNPDLALERLDDLRREVIPDLALVAPTLDYARAVSAEVFWRFNVKPGIKSMFSNAEDYGRFVNSDHDPVGVLWDHLGGQPLAPAANSWLVPAISITGLTGPQTRVRLNFEQDPPYVIMVLSVSRMRAAGVLVRSPRGVDAIPSRHLQWFPENVPDEQIDGTLPVEALEVLEWRR